MHKFWRKLREQAGMAMDELLVVVVLCSGLGGFLTVAVPWDEMVGGGAAYKKIIHEFELVEAANSAFHKAFDAWPHQTTDGDWKRNVAVLKYRQYMRPPYQYFTNYTNFLPEHKVDVESGELLRQSLGRGSIQQHEVTYRGSRYLEIVMDNVPFDEARAVDEAVDGSYDPQNGRVFIIFDGESVELRYRANKISS